MDIRYSANQCDFKCYTTQEIRDEFLIENLYIPDKVVAVYSHVDRMVTLGCMPVKECVAIDQNIDIWKNFGAKFFLESRELGIFNIGGTGAIIADDQTFQINYLDCLYITKSTKEVRFRSNDADNPAKFYMVSAPAHRSFENKHIAFEDAVQRPLGDADNGTKRTIFQYIHPAVLETCQLLMGVTKLDTGSVWNTMPPHTHERRMEIYTYFGIPRDNVVFHMMGEASETRHIIVQNEQAVISPSWSIHSGCGTASYSFIWAMGGENKVFDDMDPIILTSMR